MTGPEPTDVIRVHVNLSDVVVEVRKGESVMRAAERLGYHWPTICHGQAECTACWIEVDDSAAFEAPAPIELEALQLFEGRSFYAGKNIRLACQARPVRNTAVAKRGVRPITTVVEGPMLRTRGTGRSPGDGGSGSPPARG